MKNLTTKNSTPRLYPDIAWNVVEDRLLMARDPCSAKAACKGRAISRCDRYASQRWHHERAHASEDFQRLAARIQKNMSGAQRVDQSVDSPEEDAQSQEHLRQFCYGSDWLSDARRMK